MITTPCFVIQTIGSKVQSCAKAGISILQKTEIFQLFFFFFLNLTKELKHLKA